MKNFIMMLLLVVNGYVHADMRGNYNLNVVIGEREFIDILEIVEIKGIKVKGYFSVPNVFKSDFSGVLKDQELVGEFLAKENGKEFKVILKASIISKCNLRGTLSSGGVVFGEFNGVCHE